MHTVILATSKNCDSIVQLSLSVNTPITPMVSIVADKTNICVGEKVTFNATTQNTNGTVKYQWMVNGNNVGTNSAQFISSNLKHHDVVSVKITVINGNCLTSNIATCNSITISVTKPTYTIPKVEHCLGGNSLIDLGISLSNYVVSWKNEHDSLTTINADTLRVHNLSNHTATFTIKYGNGCNVSDVIPIKVMPLPSINAISDKEYAKTNQTIQLDVIGNNLTSFHWQPSALISNPNIKNPTANITETIVFVVTAKDIYSCENTDSVTVNFIDECDEKYIYFPTAFSPNFDGINDCFGILSPPTLSNYKMVIFNRWSENVFETNDKLNCWDGTFKGSDAPADSYVYVVSFICSNGKSIYKKGMVSILR